MSYTSELVEPINVKAIFQLDPQYDALTAPTGVKAEYGEVSGEAPILTQYSEAVGFESLEVGLPKFRYKQVLSVVGIEPEEMGYDINVINGNPQVFTDGIESLEIGDTTVELFKRYIELESIEASFYGEPYLLGGVKYIEPVGDVLGEFGDTLLINTKAEQYIKPLDFDSLVVADPKVSPHIIYTTGINSLILGAADVRTPVLFPVSYIATSYGTTTAWFHTRYLMPTGTLSYQPGFPLVADLAQFIQAPSLTESAVFGDIRVNNLFINIKPRPIFDGVFSDYALIANRDRFITSAGLPSQYFGSTDIQNKSPALYAEGIDSLEQGASGIGYRFRSVQPIGFDRLGVGNAALTKTPEVFPDGYDVAEYGSATISNAIRYIRADGLEQSLYGDEPNIWFRYRNIKPLSWQSFEFESPVVTHGVREIIGIGSLHDEYGDAWISQGSRLIAPISIIDVKSSNHMIGMSQEVKPYGYTATLFGTRIIPESSGVYAEGFDGSFGLNSIELFTRQILPAGYISVGSAPDDRWGNATAYNQSQYIVQVFDGDNGLVPPKWSEWTLIENRDKQSNVAGLSSLRFGYSKIDNNAAPLLPTGIASPVGNSTAVSHKIRFIKLNGIEPILISSWTMTYNAARVIAPQGYVNTLHGEPEAVNTRRYYNNIGRLDSLEISAPMIAYRIRTIDIESRYSIEPPQINLPTVDLFTRYIAGIGYKSTAYGFPALSIHFNIISPRWVHREKPGNPSLRNVTPELLVNGHDSSEFGVASLRTQWRDVYAFGDTATWFGLTHISDTKRTIEVRGLQSSIASQEHVVTKTGTNPYVLQNIWLINESTPEEDGYGIEPPLQQVPYPSLNQNVLYQQGHISSEFGTTVIHSNNIEIIGIGINGVGEDVAVLNKLRFIDLDRNGITSSLVEFGKPWLSPHTIWAVVEAPQQAIDNHNSIGLELVNSEAVFGELSIESSIRAINHYSANDENEFFGQSLVTLSTQKIICDGFRLSRLGIPVIPFTLQKILLREGVSESEWGDAVVDHPPYIGPMHVELQGLDSLKFGDIYSDNLDRCIFTQGADSLCMGESKYDDNPYMWQSLRVGEYVPFIVGGDTMLRVGAATITLRVREIGVQSFNSFRSEYELQNFRERIKVFNSDKKLPEKITIKATGIETSANIGYQDIKLGQHFIRPDGNSDQFRKGGYHA